MLNFFFLKNKNCDQKSNFWAKITNGDRVQPEPDNPKIPAGLSGSTDTFWSVPVEKLRFFRFRSSPIQPGIFREVYIYCRYRPTNILLNRLSQLLFNDPPQWRPKIRIKPPLLQNQKNSKWSTYLYRP